MAHKLISFYKSVGCLIVHHSIGKSQLVRTGTSWKNTEHFTDILNSEVGSWGKTVENPCQTKTAYAETPLCQEILDNSRMLPAERALINQCEIQSDLKESLTLACSDHPPAPYSCPVKTSRHFHVWHTPGALVGSDFLSQCISDGICST